MELNTIITTGKILKKVIAIIDKSRLVANNVNNLLTTIHVPIYAPLYETARVKHSCKTLMNFL